MWSTGTLIGLPILAILLLIIVGVIVLGLLGRDGFVVLIALGAAVVVLVIFGAGFYPWEKEYHYWGEQSGVVAEVDSRLLPSGDSMEEKFVVRFEGSEQEYGCTDTRCALVEPGDYLVLSCKRQWQYSGTDGWDCNFNRNEGQG